MTQETQILFDAYNLTIGQEYLQATHNSTPPESPQSRIVRAYDHIPKNLISRLETYYRPDLVFFNYTINVKTLSISY